MKKNWTLDPISVVKDVERKQAKTSHFRNEQKTRRFKEFISLIKEFKLTNNKHICIHFPFKYKLVLAGKAKLSIKNEYQISTK